MLNVCLSHQVRAKLINTICFDFDKPVMDWRDSFAENQQLPTEVSVIVYLYKSMGMYLRTLHSAWELTLIWQGVQMTVLPSLSRSCIHRSQQLPHRKEIVAVLSHMKIHVQLNQILTQTQVCKHNVMEEEI